MNNEIKTSTKSNGIIKFLPKCDYKIVKGGIEVTQLYDYFWVKDIHTFPEKLSFWKDKDIFSYEEDYNIKHSKEVIINFYYDDNGNPRVMVLADRYGDDRKSCTMPWDMFNKIMSKVFVQGGEFFNKISEEIYFEDSYRF